VKVVALGLLLVAAVASGCAGGGVSRDGVEVTNASLRPGEIALVVENGSDDVARVAQVILNDAFVDFRAPRRVLPPDVSETIIVSYPWIAGEAYDIELLTSSGASADFEIEDAS
jgi:zinc transporter, ZIP family